MLTDFESRLRQSNLSSNTIESYSKAVRQYFSLYDTVTKHNLLSFKGYLIEKYKPKTVNLRLQAINRYLEYLKKDHLKLKFVKVQQQNFLENVISDADYRFFIKKLNGPPDVLHNIFRTPCPYLMSEMPDKSAVITVVRTSS